MTAAAVGAIAAQQTPEMAKDVAAFAAASNLIATTLGTYLTLFISLPFAVWAYRVLEPVLGRRHSGEVATAPSEMERAAAGMSVPDLKWLERLLAWAVVGAMVLLGNWVGGGGVEQNGRLAGVGDDSLLAQHHALDDVGGRPVSYTHLTLPTILLV